MRDCADGHVCRNEERIYNLEQQLAVANMRADTAEAEVIRLREENAALREADRWLLTVERLPREFDQVIGWYGDWAGTVWWQNEDGQRTWWRSDGEEVGEPSHWWPVPEPPEPAHG